MSSPSPAHPGSRLMFIDMARSVAILLMLEGHFVDLTLMPEWRKPGWLIYDVWNFIRGFTAPMFFTVTGLVFAYLLTGQEKEPGFFRLPRVKKGLVRTAELLFWGYLLQVDLRRVPEYLKGDLDAWMQAFHVLQCIGMGLLGMIVVFGFWKITGRKLSLTACYVAAALLVFFTKIGLNQLPADAHIPAGAPLWLQNMVKGPLSVFPLAPWLAYTFYGAAFGSLVRRHRHLVRGQIFPPVLLAAAIVLIVAGWWVDFGLHHLLFSVFGSPENPVFTARLHMRFGEVLAVLAALLWLENRFHPKDSWFFEIGRNTFPVYVLHVVVLYGGIFGIGLRSFLEKSLTPWQAAAGAVAFMAFFALVANLSGAVSRFRKNLRLERADRRS